MYNIFILLSPLPVIYSIFLAYGTCEERHGTKEMLIHASIL